MKFRYKFPKELEFEPLQQCNAKCFTCPYTELSKDNAYTTQKMDRDHIEKLLTDFLEKNKKYNKNQPALITPFRYSDPLICKDLDLIFKISKDYNALVQITTNAKGFTDKNVYLLNEYKDSIKSIAISIIGDTEENVAKYMGPISLEKTKKTLYNLKDTAIKNKIVISLRQVDKSDEEWANLQNLQTFFTEIGYKTTIKKDWIANRNEQNFYTNSNNTTDIKQFVVGCNLYDDKLLKRLEVMVNGDVVLCCDDSVGHTVFGNVFQGDIEEIWNGKLFDYTNMIYQKQYAKEKDLLICSTCSRAKLNTDKIQKNSIKQKIKNFKKRFSKQYINIGE